MKPPIITLSPVCTKERVLMLPSQDVGDVLVAAVIVGVLVSPTSQMSVMRKNGRRSLFILFGETKTGSVAAWLHCKIARPVAVARNCKSAPEHGKAKSYRGRRLSIEQIRTRTRRP